MRILHLSSEFPPLSVFGLGRYVHELTEAQAELGYQVEVVTNSIGGLDNSVVKNGVSIRRVAYPPPPKAPTTSAMLLHFNLQLIERVIELRLSGDFKEFDVINAHDWLTVPAAFHLGRLLRAPVVTTIHDVIFNKVRQRKFTNEDAFVAGIENWACHFSEKIIVLSEAIRQEIFDAYHVEAARICLVRSGIKIEPCSENEFYKIASWRSKLAANDENLLLFAGRLDAEKGLPTLLSAMLAVKREHGRKCRVAIAGTGHLESYIDEFCKSRELADVVARVGYLRMEELRIAYAAADVVVVPSDYEPFGLVALEAQQMGTPVIVANTGGLAETLALTEGGLSFRVGDSEELTRVIGRLLSDSQLRGCLGSKGQANVKQHFNWRRIVKNVEEIYKSVRGSAPPENVTPPAWQHLPIESSNISGISKRSVHPLSDLTIFCDPTALATLPPILECLVNAHALIALDGRINVVPILCRSQDEKWHPPYVNPRVEYVEIKSAEQIRAMLRQTASVITMPELHEPLVKSGLLLPKLIPTIWCGTKPIGCYDGLEVSDTVQLYALANKLLCDNRLRQAMAPELFNPIPPMSWTSPQHRHPHVVHVLPQIVTGGAETTLLEIVNGTCGQYRHSILCFSNVCEGPLSDEFRQKGVDITIFSDEQERTALEYFRLRCPNLIHLHSMSYVPSWIPIHRQFAGQCIIETEHVVNIGSGHFGPVDLVACVSEATKRAHDPYEALWQGKGSKWEIIYNGLDERNFESIPDRMTARKRLGLPENRPIIGRVSALARNKLPMEALEAIPHILNAVPQALFVIVGDGSQRKEAEAWVNQRGLAESVRFLGERRDIPQVLAAFDVFAYYTTKDALGNVILEAIAAGIPVVTTEVEGTREALGDAPGEAIALGDLGAFASAVARWLKVSQESKPAYALPEKFTRRFMANRYAAIYARHLKQPVKETARKGSGHKLLIKFPTRSRPEKFFPVLDKYIAMLSRLHTYEIVVSCDDDDPAMNNAAVRKRLSEYGHLSFHFGAHKNKVQAINAGLVGHDFSVLLLASDDMVPQVAGYDDVIMQQMDMNFPDLDGVLFFNDGYRGHALNTLVIAGRKYLERFGYIYNPAYKSLWCDNEFTQVANLLERQVFINHVIIRHEHPNNTGKGLDMLYSRNDEPFDADLQTYQRRKHDNFGLGLLGSRAAESSVERLS